MKRMVIVAVIWALLIGLVLLGSSNTGIPVTEPRVPNENRLVVSPAFYVDWPFIVETIISLAVILGAVFGVRRIWEIIKGEKTQKATR